MIKRVPEERPLFLGIIDLFITPWFSNLAPSL